MTRLIKWFRGKVARHQIPHPPDTGPARHEHQRARQELFWRSEVAQNQLQELQAAAEKIRTHRRGSEGR